MPAYRSCRSHSPKRTIEGLMCIKFDWVLEGSLAGVSGTTKWLDNFAELISGVTGIARRSPSD